MIEYTGAFLVNQQRRYRPISEVVLKTLRRAPRPRRAASGRRLFQLDHLNHGSLRLADHHPERSADPRIGRFSPSGRDGTSSGESGSSFLRVPCKSFVKRKHTSLDTRFLRSAQYRCRGTNSSHVCLSAMVPAVAEPDIHSLYRARRPSQKIEFVFSASPETIRGSIGRLLSFAQSATCGTWRPARCANSVSCRPCGGSKPLLCSDFL